MLEFRCVSGGREARKEGGNGGRKEGREKKNGSRRGEREKYRVEGQKR